MHPSPRSHEPRQRDCDDISSAPAHKPFGNQTGLFILGHIARCAYHAFPFAVLLFPLDVHLVQRALEVLSEGTWLGVSPYVCSQPQVGLRGVRSGSCVRAWVGDSKIALSSSESTSGSSPLSWTRANTVCVPRKVCRWFRDWVLLVGSSIDRSPGVHVPRHRGCRRLQRQV